MPLLLLRLIGNRYSIICGAKIFFQEQDFHSDTSFILFFHEMSRKEGNNPVEYSFAEDKVERKVKEFFIS